MKGKESMKHANNNRGFSLVEVLLAIVILGLVAAPILQMFVTSAQINLRSRKLMAATDVATMTMEYMNGMKFDGDGGIKKIFTDSGTTTKLPAISYSTAYVHDMGSVTCTSVDTFASKVVLQRAAMSGAGTSVGGKRVFWGVNGDDVGVAFQNVEYNGQTLDMVIWFDNTKTAGDIYYTYDVEIAVYDVLKESTVDEHGNLSTADTSHFSEQLISVDGAIANQ